MRFGLLGMGAFCAMAMTPGCQTAEEQAIDITRNLEVRTIAYAGGNPDDGSLNPFEEVSVNVVFFNNSDQKVAIDTTMIRSGSADLVVVEGARTDGCGYITFHGKCLDLDASKEGPNLSLGKVRTTGQAAGNLPLELIVTGSVMTSSDPEEWTAFKRSINLDAEIVPAAPVLGVTLLELTNTWDSSGVTMLSYELRISNTGNAASIGTVATISIVPSTCCIIGDAGGASIDVPLTDGWLSNALDPAQESGSEYFTMGVNPGQSPATLHIEFADESGRAYPAADLPFQ
jgi:hypothetical protein